MCSADVGDDEMDWWLLWFSRLGLHVIDGRCTEAF